MKKIFRLRTKHDDLLHDIAYDYYGSKLATCSSDKKIKVWHSSDGHYWELSAKWNAHDASILKLCWSDPEYGNLLASASVDRSVKIWEETNPEIPRSSAKWIECAKLIESKTKVQDIEFAPRHLGLKLATCSSDGWIRIYESLDVLNYTSWTLINDFDASEGEHLISKEKEDAYSISWCKSHFLPPMFIIGCGQLHLAKVKKKKILKRNTPSFYLFSRFINIMLSINSGI
jgi:nucleoporin SEH1